MKYAPQERTEHAGQPDITGRDENGHVVLIIEAKFWAGLTVNQPVQYLRLVDPSGLLLFISPEVRLQELWTDLYQRARSCGMAIEWRQGSGQFTATVDDRTMALISWRRLLDTLRESAKQANDRVAESDLQQLWDFCEQMDTEAFFPLRQEEICDVGHAKRSLHYCELVDLIAGQAKARGICQRLRSSGGFGYYGIDLRFGDLRLFLAYSPLCWSAWGKSPLWLQVSFDWMDNRPFDGRERTQIKAALASADRTGGPLREEGDSTFFIPISLRAEVSKEEIVEDSVRQLESVGASLAKSTGNAIRFACPEA